MASFLIPWFAALGASSPASRLSDDVPLIRSLGLAPLGFEGLVSTGLGAAFDFLPIGSRALRLSWIAALGLGLFSFVLYRVTLACQRAARRAVAELPAGDEHVAPIDAALALASALAATLGPLFLTEGAAPGGFALAAALALGSVAIGTGVFRWGERTPLVLGAAIGLTLLESRWAGLGALAALGVHAAAHRGELTQRAILAFGSGALVLLALPVALFTLAWVAPSPGLELARASFRALPENLLRVDQSAALSAWSSGVGLLWCGLSVMGLVVGLARPSTRRRVLPLAALLLFDAVVGPPADASLRDPLGAVRLLGVAALAASGALGVSEAIRLLQRERIPFSRAASTLMVVYAFTLVFVSAEQSARAALSRERGAADTVTDEVLASLAPSAVVLVRSAPIFLRLHAMRLARGSRPDVLAVSMPLLERGGAQAEALSHQQELVPLVRDVLLGGRPSEFALSALADVRPLYVEPDLTWDPRLFSHLVPRPFFTEFAPHPLGRSDRRLGLEQAARTGARLSAALAATEDGDPATRALFATQLGQRALVLSVLGDRDAARAVVGELLALEPNHELGLRLKTRVDRPGRGPIDVGEPFAVR